jgi:hypothetical protein
MKWPFVSRARFDDRERQIVELKQELVEAKLSYARVVDEINFRSTGFHLDPRFATAPAPAEATPTPAAAAATEELTGMAKVMSEVGRRPSAIRKALEFQSLSEMEKAEAAARAGRENERRAEAARRLEEVLESTKSQAAQA